jgi:hypothetical protein
MSKNSEGVKNWRRRTKARIVEAMGGCCVCCGYNECHEALDLHHINPEEKEMSFGKMRKNPKAWSKIVVELRKCVLVCCRCHAEIHHGTTVLPDSFSQFNEAFVDHRKTFDYDECPICGGEKDELNKTCSYSCAAKLSNSVTWDDDVVLEMLDNNESYISIGKRFGVTGAAAKKRCDKIFLHRCRCGDKKDRNADKCLKCHGLSKRKVDRPSKKRLEKMIATMSWCAIGRKYDVSDNAVRKWAKGYELI